ncbi:hypothetical protein SCHPADRAFT_999547 [Schizopora paradoxa]|uniref:F-box domain-containing protein n=1 Tax=Schizopora paradoxa TaxID=27342 RepID=A0A0H2RG18_9AGAM|nr:hypothetical protein SCHPADRAFT_999547 [Schizopora paradoxa]
MVGRIFYFAQDSLETRRKWFTMWENMQFIGQKTWGMTFPNLRRLDACFSRELSSKHWGPNFKPFCHWSMPNLVDLRISGYHPPPTSVSFVGSLQFLRMHFDAQRGEVYEIVQLTRFLSVCKALEKVDLRFVNWISASPCPIHDILSVQDVSVKLQYCKTTVSASICSSIRFPNATKAYLSLNNCPYMQCFDDFSEGLAAQRESLIRGFLLGHPLLNTFSLEYMSGAGRDSPIQVNPAIHVLPSLEKLVLKFVSWQELVFWDFPSSFNTKFLPSVRSLELHTYNLALQWEGLRIWLEQFFAQLKKQGDIDTFESFSIYNKEKFDPSVLSKGLLSELLPSEKILVHQTSS